MEVFKSKDTPGVLAGKRAGFCLLLVVAELWSLCFGETGGRLEAERLFRGEQIGFGFYSLMLTSLLLGLIVMVLYKPRTWCTFCPMGTMTQGICKLKNNEKK